MKIRGSLLTPVFAVLTVVAILAVGVVLGQLHAGAPWVRLLGSIAQPDPGFAAGTPKTIASNEGGLAAEFDASADSTTLGSSFTTSSQVASEPRVAVPRGLQPGVATTSPEPAEVAKDSQETPGGDRSSGPTPPVSEGDSGADTASPSPPSMGGGNDSPSIVENPLSELSPGPQLPASGAAESEEYRPAEGSEDIALSGGSGDD
ncbi:MAG: hypothetical protein M1274_05015 [Actinobacteria bacterium]|nr:hypothetical protein [Actinomycetota bacterium]